MLPPSCEDCPRARDSYRQTVKRTAFERPVVLVLPGSRIHHWAYTVSPGLSPTEFMYAVVNWNA